MSGEPDGKALRLERLRPVLADAHSQGLRLAALGGAAIQLLCPTARGEGPWARSLADLDLASVNADRREVEVLLVSHGFLPEERFNLMNGSFRLRFGDTDSSHLDVFMNSMELCHRIDWSRSLKSGMETLPLVELLMTKLQIVELEEKDLTDLCALLVDNGSELEDDLRRLSRLIGEDWGLWRTSLSNMERLTRIDHDAVRTRADSLVGAWHSGPRSLSWRARSLIGTRVRWYQEPEEV